MSKRRQSSEKGPVLSSTKGIIRGGAGNRKVAKPKTESDDGTICLKTLTRLLEKFHVGTYYRLQVTVL